LLFGRLATTLGIDGEKPRFPKEGKINTPNTHYLVVDREDNEVLAWFPKTEMTSEGDARHLASDVHDVAEGYWSGTQFVIGKEA
jgi:hypothetical protein